MLAVTLILQFFDYALEWFMVLARPFLNAHDNVAVHLQETPIRIPGEARVVCFLRNNLHYLVVHPEVQDRVHHSRHGIAGARAHGDEQRPLLVTEFFFDGLFNLGQRICDLCCQLGRIAAFVIVKITANLCGECKSRWHRQTDARHLVEVCPFSAEERFHAA